MFSNLFFKPRSYSYSPIPFCFSPYFHIQRSFQPERWTTLYNVLLYPIMSQRVAGQNQCFHSDVDGVPPVQYRLNFGFLSHSLAFIFIS